MTPFGPVSLALLHDLRMRSLSWAERGVLHHLSLVAGVSPDGATVHLDRRAGEAEVASWSRALGADGAAIVGRLVELGLLSTCHEGLRLVLVARPAPVASAPRAAAEEWQGKPSDSPAAERARNDRKKFKARVSPFSRVPADLSWEAWLATDEGEAFLAKRAEQFHGYGEWAVPHTGTTPSVPPTGTATEGGTYRPGTAPVPPPSLPPHTPLSFPEKKEEEGGGTASGGTAQNGGTGTAPQVPPLVALRDAVGGRATLTGALAIEVELSRLLERHALTPDEIKRAGAAFEDPSAWWPRGKNSAPRHVTLNDLAGFRGDDGYEWRALAALVAHVRASKRTTPKPVTAPARPTTTSRVMTAEETRRAIEASRGARRDSSPPAPIAAPVGGSP